MPRELKQSLQDYLATLPGAEYASWLVLTLPKLQGTPAAAITGRTYHLATSEAVIIGGIKYDPQLQEIGEILRDTDRAAETCTAAVQNITTEFGNVLLNDANFLLGATVTAGRWWRDPNSGTEYAEQMFSGIVDDAQGLPRKSVTLFLLSDAYAAASIGGGRAVERDCQYVFNSKAVRDSLSGLGDACGYLGGLADCNKLHTDDDGCSGRANTHRYGGAVKSKSGSAPSVQKLTQINARYQIAKVIPFDNGAVTTKAQRPFYAVKEDEGLTLRDNATETRTELTTISVPTRWRNLMTDFHGSPSETLTTGSISSGTNLLTVASATGWEGESGTLPGHGILIAGAGASGADLITEVISIAGLVFTLADNAGTPVAGARVQHDNSAAIQSAVDALEYRNIYIPRGNYLFARQIMLPSVGAIAITEGIPLIVRGAGKSVTKMLYQNTDTAFVAQPDEPITSCVFAEMTLICTEPGDVFSSNVANSQGWAFDLTEATVVNRFALKDMIIHSWGRGALVGANLQNCVLSDLEIRLYNTAAIALVSPETIYVSAPESNVTTIKDCLIELGQYVADADVALTGLTWNSGTKIITAGSALFTAAHLNRFIRIDDAGQTGGDVIAIVKSIDSSTQITVSAPNNSGGTITGGTGTIYKTNIGSIYLHRASQGKHQNITIQGNWSNAVTDHVTSAVIAHTCNGVHFDTLWVEDTGGHGGPDIELIGTSNISVSNYHTNSDPGLFPACHSFFMRLTDAKSTSIAGMDGVSSSSPFEINGASSLFVDHSQMGFPGGRLTLEGYNKVIYGENVTFRLNSNESIGTASLYDAVYGEQHVLNPRFDTGTGGLGSWTQNIAGALSTVNAGSGREQKYLVVNRQGEASSGSFSLAISQTITIPDDVPAGPWVLGVDWRVDDFGTPRNPTGGGGMYIEVGATGTGSVGYPVSPAQGLRWSNNTTDGTPEDTWFRSNFRLTLGTGASRTFIIRIYSTAGAQTPRLHVTNWRLHSGRHAAYSYEQPATLSSLITSGLTRERLAANRFYYVATTGNDANDGLAVGTPFLTIQKAVDVVAALDLSIFEATIQVADGSYIGQVILKNLISGSARLKGNITTPANVIITTAGLGIHCVTTTPLVGVNNWTVEGFRLVSGNYGVYLDQNSLVYLGAMEYGAVPALTGAHIYAAGNSVISIAANYRIIADAAYHWYLEDSSVLNCRGRTIDLIGTRNFSFFAVLQRIASAYAGFNMFKDGAGNPAVATGVRYVVTRNAVFDSEGGGPNYLPGSAAGFTQTGGQYI